MSGNNRFRLTPEQKAEAEAFAIREAQAGRHSFLAKDGKGLEVIRTPRVLGPAGPHFEAVCTALSPDADLWIMPQDDDDLIVALVNELENTDIEFENKGWILVRDGRRVGYQIGQDVFVPQFHLKDSALLKTN